MSFILNLIKQLFPDQTITHHINDLYDQLLQKNNNKSIYISIEKQNKTRQYCYLTMEQLLTLYQNSPAEQRTLYELILPEKKVKTYIDFEYYIDKNSDIENHHIALLTCLKILYYLLNRSNDDQTNDSDEIVIQNILEQFLVLQASTSEKISYHIIHANPTIIFENISILGTFIKTVIHFLLISIIQHKCSEFNIIYNTNQTTVSQLINILVPQINTIRKKCTSCSIPIPNTTVSDIAHLIVRNKTNEYTLAIDTNVYCKNQQFRLFNCVKYGKNNPLILSNTCPFNYQLNPPIDYLLIKSLITFIEDNEISYMYLKNNKFQINTLANSKSNSNSDLHIDTFNLTSQKFTNIEIINDHTKKTSSLNITSNNNHKRKLSYSIVSHKINTVDLYQQHLLKFTNFIEKLIKSEASHEGHIHSCVRGTYNKNLLFFNIGGNYRYCPKKKDHHQSNTVAIMINIKNSTYCIRCKDPNCNNNNLEWKKI